MDGQLVEKMTLDNGLVLQLWDYSKLMAGDRWLVSFLALIEVDVRSIETAPGSEDQRAGEDIRAVLGETTQYRYQKQSYFVDVKEKDAVFYKLKKDFLDTNLPYISNPEFARKLVFRQYGEAKKRYGKVSGDS